MARLKKLRKIYRILFPIKITANDLFENKLQTNHMITSFGKISEEEYILNVNNTFKLVLRNQNFSDYEVFKQIFNIGEYNVVLNMLRLNTHFKEKKVIIDAGANVGYTSIFFSNYLENLKIYAIEPSLTNFEILKKNIDLKSSPEDFKIYHRALSEKPNSVYKIERNFGDKKDWAITTHEDIEGDIEGITLKEIIQENSLNYISLLKIDIEGAERFLFKKDNDFSFLNITEIIAIEIHDKFPIREDIYEILKSHGFLIFNTSETTIGLNQNVLNK